jgi:uncharacterized protein DUF6338
MPNTFQALAVLLLALLPGALFIWGFERISGRWVIGLSDRILRFFGISALFQALAAPATYAIWHKYLREGALSHDKTVPWWLWAVVVVYVALPFLIGSWLAVSVEADKPWARWAIGYTDPAPTAWDFVFSSESSAWVRLKLKSGRWAGGAYTGDGYSGGYPEPPDLYLNAVAEVDPDTGEFIRDAKGDAIIKPYGLLVRWEEVEFLEFAPRKDPGNE